MSGDATGRREALTVEGGRSNAESDAGPVFARFTAPRTSTRTRLGVVADPHLTPTGSGTWKVFHRSEERLRAAVDVLNDVGVDATCVLGNLTRDGATDVAASSADADGRAA